MASYAAATRITVKNSDSGKPVFLKHNEIPNVKESDLLSPEVYKAILKTIPSSEIKGIQRVGGLWRLYTEHEDSRVALLTNGINLRNACITTYDINPFLPVRDDSLLRLTIKDIPLSVSNTVIVDELEKRQYKVGLSGKVIFQKLRVDGRLTNCLTGDRVIFIEKPESSLPRSMTFGNFRGKVFHMNQLSKDVRSVVCSNCLATGHHRSTCNKPIVCRSCRAEGHLQRECTAPFDSQIRKADEDSEDQMPTASTEQQITNFLAEEREAANRELVASESDSNHDEDEVDDEDINAGDDESDAITPIASTKDQACNRNPSSNPETQSKLTRFIKKPSFAPARNATSSRQLPSGYHSDSTVYDIQEDNSHYSDISPESPDFPRQPSGSGTKRKQRGNVKRSKKK